MGKRRLSLLPPRREFPKALISMNRDLSRFKNPFRQFNDAVIRGQETGFASKYRSPSLSLSFHFSLQFECVRKMKTFASPLALDQVESLIPNSWIDLSYDFFLKWIWQFWFSRGWIRLDSYSTVFGRSGPFRLIFRRSRCGYSLNGSTKWRICCPSAC